MASNDKIKHSTISTNVFLSKSSGFVSEFDGSLICTAYHSHSKPTFVLIRMDKTLVSPKFRILRSAV